MAAQLSVSHNREDEDLLTKAGWFQSLTVDERMEYFCAFAEIVLENNPGMADNDDPAPSERVRIVSLPRI